jgi:hypothetical protein
VGKLLQHDAEHEHVDDDNNHNIGIVRAEYVSVGCGRCEQRIEHGERDDVCKWHHSALDIAVAVGFGHDVYRDNDGRGISSTERTAAVGRVR